MIDLDRVMQPEGKTFREYFHEQVKEIVADAVHQAMAIEREQVACMLEQEARTARNNARQHMDESAVLGWISAAEYLAQRVRMRQTNG